MNEQTFRFYAHFMLSKCEETRINITPSQDARVPVLMAEWSVGGNWSQMVSCDGQARSEIFNTSSHIGSADEWPSLSDWLVG